MANQILSPVKLLNYQVLDVAFVTKPETVKKQGDIDLGITTELKQREGGETNYLFILGLTVNESEARFEELGFRASVRLAAYLELPAEWPPEKKSAHASLNGLSVLYATARALLADISSQTPLGRFVLPTIDLAAFVNQDAEQPRPKTGRRRAPTS